MTSRTQIFRAMTSTPNPKPRIKATEYVVTLNDKILTQSKPKAEKVKDE